MRKTSYFYNVYIEAYDEFRKDSKILIEKTFWLILQLPQLFSCILFSLLQVCKLAVLLPQQRAHFFPSVGYRFTTSLQGFSDNILLLTAPESANPTFAFPEAADVFWPLLWRVPRACRTVPAFYSIPFLVICNQIGKSIKVLEPEQSNLLFTWITRISIILLLGCSHNGLLMPGIQQSTPFPWNQQMLHIPTYSRHHLPVFNHQR